MPYLLAVMVSSCPEKKERIAEQTDGNLQAGQLRPGLTRGLSTLEGLKELR